MMSPRRAFAVFAILGLGGAAVVLGPGALLGTVSGLAGVPSTLVTWWPLFAAVGGGMVLAVGTKKVARRVLGQHFGLSLRPRNRGGNALDDAYFMSRDRD
jgi:hypothetical protein